MTDTEVFESLANQFVCMDVAAKLPLSLTQRQADAKASRLIRQWRDEGKIGRLTPRGRKWIKRFNYRRTDAPHH